MKRGDRVIVVKGRRIYIGRRGVIDDMSRGNVWVRFDHGATVAFRMSSLRSADSVVEKLAKLADGS
jgi:hypothetical protein